MYPRRCVCGLLFYVSKSTRLPANPIHPSFRPPVRPFIHLPGTSTEKALQICMWSRANKRPEMQMLLAELRLHRTKPYHHPSQSQDPLHAHWVMGNSVHILPNKLFQPAIAIPSALRESSAMDRIVPGIGCPSLFSVHSFTFVFTLISI